MKKSIDDDNSSDDNSSRSTLDLIIPPPKDFHGFNNPFLNESAKQSTGEVNPPKVTANVSQNKQTNNVPPLTLFGNTNFTPTNNQIRFVNIVKRRLCEKDIMIGPNQEVKRRKYKRRSGSGPVEVCKIEKVRKHSNNFSLGFLFLHHLLRLSVQHQYTPFPSRRPIYPFGLI